jgi:hypothetical protein
MAEDKDQQNKIDKPGTKDQVALDLMRFIAETTGYGKGGPTAGFGGKPSKSAEEYADALLQLYERCRGVVGKVS